MEYIDQNKLRAWQELFEMIPKPELDEHGRKKQSRVYLTAEAHKFLRDNKLLVEILAAGMVTDDKPSRDELTPNDDYEMTVEIGRTKFTTQSHSISSIAAEWIHANSAIFEYLARGVSMSHIPIDAHLKIVPMLPKKSRRGREYYTDRQKYILRIADIRKEEADLLSGNIPTRRISKAEQYRKDFEALVLPQQSHHPEAGNGEIDPELATKYGLSGLDMVEQQRKDSMARAFQDAQHYRGH